MPRVSINEMSTYRWSFDEDVANYRAAGFTAMGVWRRKLADFGEERGIDLLRESGMSVTSFSCAGGFTGSDGHTFREAVDDGLEAIRMAAEMRAECLVVVTGARSGHTSNHARRLVSEALSEMGDLGRELGVQVAVQPMHRQPVERCSFLTTLDATLELLARCDHPNVGMVFDLFHHCRQPAVLARLPQLAPWIRVVTLSEVHSGESQMASAGNPASNPSVDLHGVTGTLARNGFRGGFELQVLCEIAWKSDYHQWIASWQSHLAATCPEFLPQFRGAPSMNSVLPDTGGGTSGKPISGAPVHKR